MARVLLVYPNIWSDVFPLSILTLSAVLKESGHLVEVFSALHRREVNSPGQYGWPEGPSDQVDAEFRQRITDFNPELLAFSVVEDAYPLARRLLDALSDHRPPVIIGGVFATFAPDKVMTHPAVNAVCIGEGEYPLREVCERLDRGLPFVDIPGLWVKDALGLIRRNGRPQGVVLDTLPTPDYSLIDRRVFQGPVPIIPHRGCPYPCTFCNSPAQTGVTARLLTSSAEDGQPDAPTTRYFRKQSMDMLARDLRRLTQEYAGKLNCTGLYFCSDTLLAWTNREFDAFIEVYSDFRIPFICHTTAETISAGRMRKLVDVGLRLVNIGVQHGNEIFRRDVLRRFLPNQELLKRFAMAAEEGALVSADFIMGFPLETPELAMDTIQFSRALRASIKNCSIFVPYHGTPLRDLAVERGYLDGDDLAVWSPEHSQLDMPEFPRAEITRLMGVFRGRKSLVAT